MFLTKLPSNSREPSGPPDPPENIVIFADTTDRYSYPEHMTPYLFVTTFFNKGQYMVNGRDITVSPRQFYFLNTNDTIGIEYPKNNRLRTCLILFKTGFVEDCLAYGFADKERLLDSPGYRQRQGKAGFASLPFELTEDMCRTLAQLSGDYRQLAGRGEVTARGNMTAREDVAAREDTDTLLFDLVLAASEQDRETGNRMQRIPATKRSTREELYRRLAVARSFMLDNIAQPLSIEQIAAEACLDKFHFLANFKSIYNTTPHRWFIEQKLQKALGFLQSGEHTVEEVCYHVGFQSPSSFSTLFKRRFGMPPSRV